MEHSAAKSMKTPVKKMLNNINVSFILTPMPFPFLLTRF